MVFLNIYQFLPIIRLDYVAMHRGGVVNLRMHFDDAGKSNGRLLYESAIDKYECEWKDSSSFWLSLRVKSLGLMRDIVQEMPMYNEQINNAKHDLGKTSCKHLQSSNVQLSSATIKLLANTTDRVLRFDVRSRFDPFLPGLFAASYSRGRKENYFIYKGKDKQVNCRWNAKYTDRVLETFKLYGARFGRLSADSVYNAIRNELNLESLYPANSIYQCTTTNAEPEPNELEVIQMSLNQYMTRNEFARDYEEDLARKRELFTFHEMTRKTQQDMYKQIKDELKDM